MGATREQLIAALRWVLERGVSTPDPRDELSWHEGNCGCCAEPVKVPAEHREAIDEVLRG